MRKAIPTASNCCDKGQIAVACTHNGKELDYLHGEGSLRSQLAL